MPIQVQYLEHVTLVSRDRGKTRHFYVDILGMQPIVRPEFAFPGDWYQAGGTLIHINEAGIEAGPGGPSPHSGSVATRGQHFAFLVDDIQSATQELRDQGLTIVSGPRQRPDGAYQVYVHDPDGHLIELCTRPQ